MNKYILTLENAAGERRTVKFSGRAGETVEKIKQRVRAGNPHWHIVKVKKQ